MLTPTFAHQTRSAVVTVAALLVGSVFAQAISAAAPQVPPVRASSKTLEPRLRFNFRQAKWKNVIEWFAQQANLHLQGDAVPPGTFTYYHDNRHYAPREAIDLLNSVLITKGYTLIRRERMLTVFDFANNAIPDILIPAVAPDQLERRGDFDIVKCTFQLAKLAPNDAKTDIEPLLGRHGRVLVLPTAKQVIVQELVGKLKTIRAMIERVENPPTKKTITEYDVPHATAEEVLTVARPLLGLQPAENVGPGIRLSTDELGTRIFATGEAENLELLTDIVARFSRPKRPTAGQTPQPLPEIGSHLVRIADPDKTLDVLKSLLSGIPDVRLSYDERSKSVIAFGTPVVHDTIKKIIARLEGEQIQFEIIPLKKIAPQFALDMIARMMTARGQQPSTDETGANNVVGGPRVAVDSATRNLFVWGTGTEIAEIREMISKLEKENVRVFGGRSYRVLPYAGERSLQALRKAESIWGRDHKNRIRLSVPNSKAPSNMRLEQRAPSNKQP